jgi:hypothetical protein
LCMMPKNLATRKPRSEAHSDDSALLRVDSRHVQQHRLGAGDSLCVARPDTLVEAHTHTHIDLQFGDVLAQVQRLGFHQRLSFNVVISMLIEVDFSVVVIVVVGGGGLGSGCSGGGLGSGVDMGRIDRCCVRICICHVVGFIMELWRLGRRCRGLALAAGRRRGSG